MGLVAIVLVGIAVLVGAALLLSLGDDGLGDAPVDHSDLGLPDRALGADDIPKLRFRTGIRGYRMEDVDAALDRVATALRAAQQQQPGTPSADREATEPHSALRAQSADTRPRPPGPPPPAGSPDPQS